MISYRPLWETMKANEVSTYRLIKLGIDRKTLYNLKHGQNVTLLTIEKLCRILNCGINDVVEIINDEASSKPAETLSNLA